MYIPVYQIPLINWYCCLLYFLSSINDCQQRWKKTNLCNILKSNFRIGCVLLRTSYGVCVLIYKYYVWLVLETLNCSVALIFDIIECKQCQVNINISLQYAMIISFFVSFCCVNIFPFLFVKQQSNLMITNNIYGISTEILKFFWNWRYSETIYYYISNGFMYCGLIGWHLPVLYWRLITWKYFSL